MGDPAINNEKRADEEQQGKTLSQHSSTTTEVSKDDSESSFLTLHNQFDHPETAGFPGVRKNNLVHETIKNIGAKSEPYFWGKPAFATMKDCTWLAYWGTFFFTFQAVLPNEVFYGIFLALSMAHAIPNIFAGIVSAAVGLPAVAVTAIVVAVILSIADFILNIVTVSPAEDAAAFGKNGQRAHTFADLSELDFKSLKDLILSYDAKHSNDQSLGSGYDRLKRVIHYIKKTGDETQLLNGYRFVQDKLSDDDAPAQDTLHLKFNESEGVLTYRVLSPLGYPKNGSIPLTELPGLTADGLNSISEDYKNMILKKTTKKGHTCVDYRDITLNQDEIAALQELLAANSDASSNSCLAAAGWCSAHSLSKKLRTKDPLSTRDRAIWWTSAVFIALAQFGYIGLSLTSGLALAGLFHSPDLTAWTSPYFIITAAVYYNMFLSPSIPKHIRGFFDLVQGKSKFFQNDNFLGNAARVSSTLLSAATNSLLRSLMTIFCIDQFGKNVSFHLLNEFLPYVIALFAVSTFITTLLTRTLSEAVVASSEKNPAYFNSWEDAAWGAVFNKRMVDALPVAASLVAFVWLGGYGLYPLVGTAVVSLATLAAKSYVGYVQRDIPEKKFTQKQRAAPSPHSINRLGRELQEVLVLSSTTRWVKKHRDFSRKAPNGEPLIAAFQEYTRDDHILLEQTLGISVTSQTLQMHNDNASNNGDLETLSPTKEKLLVGNQNSHDDDDNNEIRAVPDLRSSSSLHTDPLDTPILAANGSSQALFGEIHSSPHHASISKKVANVTGNFSDILLTQDELIWLDHHLSHLEDNEEHQISWLRNQLTDFSSEGLDAFTEQRNEITKELLNKLAEKILSPMKENILSGLNVFARAGRFFAFHEFMRISLTQTLVTAFAWHLNLPLPQVLALWIVIGFPVCVNDFYRFGANISNGVTTIMAKWMMKDMEGSPLNFTHWVFEYSTLLRSFLQAIGTVWAPMQAFNLDIIAQAVENLKQAERSHAFLNISDTDFDSVKAFLSSISDSDSDKATIAQSINQKIQDERTRLESVVAVDGDDLHKKILLDPQEVTALKKLLSESNDQALKNLTILSKEEERTLSAAPVNTAKAWYNPCHLFSCGTSTKIGDGERLLEDNDSQAKKPTANKSSWGLSSLFCCNSGDEQDATAGETKPLLDDRNPQYNTDIHHSAYYTN